MLRLFQPIKPICKALPPNERFLSETKKAFAQPGKTRPEASTLKGFDALLSLNVSIMSKIVSSNVGLGWYISFCKVHIERRGDRKEGN